ncbi:hypothetical protein F5051DRAFT_401731 [Lentinula edodes]|nr:hypothetical protein F5051DRAFT_401731 [Lentinula edodes]
MFMMNHRTDKTRYDKIKADPTRITCHVSSKKKNSIFLLFSYLHHHITFKMFHPFDFPSPTSVREGGEGEGGEGGEGEPLVLLITDQLASPADFVLVGFVVEGVKGRGGSGSGMKLGMGKGVGVRGGGGGGIGMKVMILSVSGSMSMARWGSVLGKYNINLTQHLSSGTIQFVDVVDVVSGSGLKGVYERVESYFQDGEGSEDGGVAGASGDNLEGRGGEGDGEHGSGVDGNSRIIILDDITTLHWTGLASPLELGRFCRALRGLCVKNDAVLVIRHHVLSPATFTLTPTLTLTPGDSPQEDKEPSGDALFRSLHALCTYHMDIQPLSSGRSGVVSGQIALHQGPNSTSTKMPTNFTSTTTTSNTNTTSMKTSPVKTRPRSRALQYKLTDTSAVYFERGAMGL